jgi:prolipoprotein diacylglyceryltransferase
MPAYMMSYAVWRFIAEILRNDYRGATIVDFLTPSQFISVLLLAGGLLLLAIELYVDGKKAKADVAEGDAPAETSETAETPEGETHE